MTDPTQRDGDTVSSTEHSEAGIAHKDYTNGRDDIGKEENDGHLSVPQRNKSVYSSSGRRVSEWEAIQIVAAGDNATIDAEIYEIEAELQTMSIKSTWHKPQLRLKNARYFTWLLVGKCPFESPRERYSLPASVCFYGWSFVRYRSIVDQRRQSLYACM